MLHGIGNPLKSFHIFACELETPLSLLSLPSGDSVWDKPRVFWNAGPLDRMLFPRSRGHFLLASPPWSKNMREIRTIWYNGTRVLDIARINVASKA